MRKWILLAAAVPAFMLLSWMAPAQIYVPAPEAVEAPTAPSYIAMIFHKLAAQVPELEKWALETEEYKKASSFDKQVVYEQELEKLKEVFRLSSLSEPIVIEHEEKISEYSFENKGFTVESFSAESYFPYVFAGRNYAVVIPGLMEQQWLSVPDETAAMRIDTLAAKAAALGTVNGRKVKIRLYIEPRYADARSTMKLDGRDYWLVSAILKNIAIYDGQQKIWEKVTGTPVEELTPSNREMLDLYRK
jgi:hypothetical protein